MPKKILYDTGKTDKEGNKINTVNYAIDPMYGLHTKNIVNPKPEGIIQSDEKKGLTNNTTTDNFYLGERYIGETKEIDNSGKKILLAVDNSIGTIFDKSRYSTNVFKNYDYAKDEDGNLLKDENGNKIEVDGEEETTPYSVIDENNLFASGGEALFHEFNPVDQTSGLYTENYNTHINNFEGLKSKAISLSNNSTLQTTENNLNTKNVRTENSVSIPIDKANELFANNSPYNHVASEEKNGVKVSTIYANGSGKTHASGLDKTSLQATGATDLDTKKTRTENSVSIPINNVYEKVGETPWDDENWDGSIKSNVDFQDDELIDDLGNGGSVSGSLIGTAKQTVANTGIAKGVTRLINKFTKSTQQSEIPSGTVSDDKFELLRKIKTEKYKNIKILSSRLGLFNSLENLLGTASAMFVGAMGKSTLSAILDDMTSKFTGGFGVAGLVERLGAAANSILTPEEIISLNLANYYNIYTAKPGRYVKNRASAGDKTGEYSEFTELESYLDNDPFLIKNDVNKINEKIKNIKKALGTVSGVLRTASSYVDGSKLSEIFSNNDNKKEDNNGITLTSTSRLEKEKGIFNIEDVQKTLGTDKRINTKTEIAEEPTSSKLTTLYGDKTKVVTDKKTKTIITSPLKDSTFEEVKHFDGNYLNVKESRNDFLNNIINRKLTTVYNSSNKSNVVEGEIKGDSKSILEEVKKFYKNVKTSERNTYEVGSLYIEPYVTGTDVIVDNIPFEFNPIINDGGIEAKYETEELMNRLLTVRSYIGSDSNTITLETKYLATASNKNDNSNCDIFVWLDHWTPEELFKIELKYRKLVYPYINGTNFSRPPIVRIKMKARTTENESLNLTVGELFTYPIKKGDKAIEVTSTLNDFTEEKRYIVTNVTINPIEAEDFSNAYSIGIGKESKSFKRGFSVSLTLAETTKNFLDTVPNYYHYSEAEKINNLNLKESDVDLRKIKNSNDDYNLLGSGINTLASLEGNDDLLNPLKINIKQTKENFLYYFFKN